MDKNALEIPTIPLNPSDWEYFWFQLPYAVPSLLSFMIGIFLTGVGIYSAFKREEKNLYLAFSCLTFSFGALSLVLALRGLVYNRPLLLELHKYVYFFSFFIGNSVLHLFYVLTEKRYTVIKVFNYFLYAVVLWATVDLWKGTGFADIWNVYAFGQYPKGSTSIRVWGAIASSAFYFLFTPYFIKYYRSKDRAPINIHIFIAIFLFLLLGTTNLPSLIGYHIFPGGSFFFIPMLYLAYGIFKEDILNIKDILFEKNVLFFALALFLSFTFLITSLLVVFFITPSLAPITFTKSYFLVPLFSYFTIFLTVIFIAGNNPNDKVSLLAAFSLIGNGVFSGIMTLRASFIDPLIQLRVEQISYMLIAFGPCFQWRLIFEIMNLKPNRVTQLVDILCLLCVILTQTPYFFNGFYEYEFGRISQSGIGLMLLSFTAFLTILEVIRQWSIYRKINKSPKAEWVIASLLLAGLFMLSGFPSTKGIALYSLGNIQFIPAIMILYAVIKYGSFVVKGPATKLGNRITILISAGTIVALYFYFHSLIQLYPSNISLLHIALIFPPFYLSFYSFTFILIRPFSRKLDENYTEIVSRKQEIELIKSEIERLNDFSKKLNQNIKIKDIIEPVFWYFAEYFGLESGFIGFIDKKENIFYVEHFSVPDYFTGYQINSIRNFHINFNEKQGIIYKTYIRKKEFYLSDTERISRSESLNYQIELNILKILNIKSYLIIPLIIGNEVIGIAFFTTYTPNRFLSKNDINKIMNFCEHITGALRNANLIQDLNAEKTKTDLATLEIEQLNEFSKLVNSNTDINIILQQILKYLEDTYGIDSLWLLIADNEKKTINTYNTIFPDTATVGIKEGKLNIQVPLEIKVGSIYKTFQTKRPFYINDKKQVQLFNHFSDTDKLISEVCGFRPLLQIPLILKNESIGILCLTSFTHSMDLNRSAIKSIARFGEQITSAIHNSILLEESNKAKKEVEKAKNETEALNKLIKNLNEDLDLNVIMKKVHEYIKENYNINYYGLSIVDTKKENVISSNHQSPEFISDADKERISNLSTKIRDVRGAHALAIKAKRPLYTPRSRTSGITPEELFLYETLKFESLLIIPLILQNEPIGLLDLYNVGKMELSKADITKLSILGEQLAGIIYGSNLFLQVQEEREKAMIAREEAEKAKKQVEELNQFLKRIHEKDSIPGVLEEVKTYVQLFYGVHYFLWLHNPKENSIVYNSGYYANEQIKEDFLKNGNRKLSLSKKGIHSLASKRKTYTFLSNIKNRSVGNEEEDKNQEIFKMSSLLLVPLYVQDTLIGILDFSQQEQNKLTKTELERIYIFCQQIAGIIQNFSLLDEVTLERDKSEKLLLNILPEEVAMELKEKGYTEPVLFDSVSVLFTDFKGFTKISETMSPNELLKELDGCFVQFDKITERYNLEKLKTIGDSYMCASGLPKRNNTHAVDSILAALEIQAFMNQMKEIKEMLGIPFWELRLGIHSGPLVAGVIGEKKFAYDVWGDTVNTASRMESSGTPGMINVSSTTYSLVKDFFRCEYRGKVNAKNKGEVDMYFVHGILPHLAKNEDGRTPNSDFNVLYERLKNGEALTT